MDQFRCTDAGSVSFVSRVVHLARLRDAPAFPDGSYWSTILKGAAKWRRLGSLIQTLMKVLDGRVAIASDRLETLAILNVNVATPVLYELCPL